MCVHTHTCTHIHTHTHTHTHRGSHIHACYDTINEHAPRAQRSQPNWPYSGCSLGRRSAATARHCNACRHFVLLLLTIEPGPRQLRPLGLRMYVSDDYTFNEKRGLQWLCTTPLTCSSMIIALHHYSQSVTTAAPRKEKREERKRKRGKRKTR